MADDPKKGQAAQQPDEPQWFGSIPEEHRQAAREGWLRQQDYTRKTQDLADQRRQAEEAAKQYGDPKEWATWYQQVQPALNQFAQLQAGQQSGTNSPAPAQQQAAPNPNADPWSGWDLLQPAEQAAMMRQAVASEVIAMVQQQYVPLIQKAFQDFDNYNKGYMSLWRRAFEQKLADPSTDLDRLFETAINMQTGRIDPLEAAQKLSVTPEETQQRTDKVVEERIQQARTQWDEEQKSKQAAIPVGTGVSPTVFESQQDVPKTPQEARERTANIIAEKYGSGIF